MASGDQETQNADILQRILNAVEKDHRQRWVEIACALVLSLATVASTWCVYQSSQWNGEQTLLLNDVDVAESKRAQSELEAVQQRAFEASMFISFAQAYNNDDLKMADFLYQRFRPEMKNAVDAWSATKPRINKDAPRSPFVMKEYVQESLTKSEEFAVQVKTLRKRAEEADQVSDTYLTVTLFLAIVLFLAGFAGVIDGYRLQRMLITFSIVIFIISILMFVRLPVILV